MVTLKEAALAWNEAREVLTDGKQELSETKKILHDQKNSQYSIKIPKSLALKADIDGDSEMVIVVNPKEETIRNIKSSILIYKKEGKNGERKEGT